MPFYICEEHSLAWQGYPALISHYVQAHPPGGERPAKEDVEQDELPVGVELRVSKQKQKEREKEEKGEVPGKEFIVDELPTEPPELFYNLLRLKGVSEQMAQRLRREFKLSPWMWGDAQEIASLLKGAKLGVGADWIRSFLKQYGNTAEIPSDDGGVGFIGGPRRRDEFFGQLDRSASQDPLATYLRFQTQRDAQREERTLDPETERRMKEIEASNRQLMETQDRLLELLEKQEKDAEKAALEARFDRLEERLTQRPREEEGGGWLTRFLDEREKRHETLIKDLGDKLAQATSDVSEAKREAKSARAEALSEDEERSDRVRKKLEETGYAPRQKSTEERVLDIMQEQVAPALIAEVKEGRRLVERVTGQTVSTSPTTPKMPVSTEEASNLAEIIMIEQQLQTAL